MKQSVFHERMETPTTQGKVAHKIGDAYDFRHDVAIVYTNSPYVIAIFTDHSNYDTISNISKDIYEVLK